MFTFNSQSGRTGDGIQLRSRESSVTVVHMELGNWSQVKPIRAEELIKDVKASTGRKGNKPTREKQLMTL